MASDAGQPVIFLSYAHADAKRAKALAAALGGRGFTVWWDTMIEGGASFAKSIREALDAADAVVVLWSRTSIESDWVADEAAQGRDRKRLVPLSLDGSLPPLGFRQYQTIDLSHWRGRAAGREMEAVERAILQAIGQSPVVARAASLAHGPGVDRRRAMLMAGGAGALLAGGGALYAWRDNLFGDDASDRTLAVLPFKNLSGDASQAYLSDGLTEEVRAGLIRNAGLRVLAATTSNSVRDDTGGATAIAAKLGVSHLLEGSVQRAGDVARVAIELTDGKTGFTTWSKRIDARLTDIFAFQTEVARTVSEALSARMATQDPAPGGTRSIRAYEEYLKGRALYLAASDEASDRAAMAHFEIAIAADPQFALARAGLSRVLASLAASNAEAGELKSLYNRAIDEATKATTIAPRLAEGHLALGYALFSGRLDMKAARPSYDLAAKLGAGDGDILLLYGLFAVRQRRFAEARDAIGRATVLDPLNPRTWRAAGSIALASGRPSEAIARYDRALALNPKMSNAHALKGYALIALKRWKPARDALDQESSAMFRLTGLAILGQKIGDKALAEKSFAELIAREGDAALYQQAQVLAQWGRNGDALDRLERARTVGDPGLTNLAVDPFIAPLTKEPRYQALMRSIGFA